MPVAVVHLPGMNTTDLRPSSSRQAGTLTLTVWPDTPVGEHQRYGYRIEDTETGRPRPVPPSRPSVRCADSPVYVPSASN